MVTSTCLTEIIIEVKDISKLEEILCKVEEIKKSYSDIKIIIRVAMDKN